jgi:uncharacterized membrane protein YdjX (TVP38/TMEM64 family)
MTRSRFLAILRLVAIVALVVAGLWFVRSSEYGRQNFNLAAIRAWVEARQPYDRPAFVLLYAVGALFIPGTVLSFVSAVLFGVLQGTLLTWIGATLGSLPPFFIARRLGRPALEGMLEGQREGLDKLDRWIAERGFRGLLLVRLLPIFPFLLVNYGCGFTTISLRAYASATAIGLLPGVFFYQYLFAAAGERILTTGIRWEDLRDPALLAPVAAFVAFVVAGNYLARRLQFGPQVR